MSFDAPLTRAEGWRAMRVRLFILGHTFEEIDALSVQDAGDIATYLEVEAKIKQKAASRRRPKGVK